MPRVNALSLPEGRTDVEPVLRPAPPCEEPAPQRLLAVAAANGAQALVLGAFGCGAFRNDPAVVAQAYANILSEFRRHFLAIEFAVFCRPVSTWNYDAFASAMRGV